MIDTICSYCVNALSGWWLISTVAYTLEETNLSEKCQCPLGLMTHFYMVMLKDRDGVFSGVNALSGWWLISTPEMYYLAFDTMLRVNALSGWWLISTLSLFKQNKNTLDRCQCPLRLMTHFYMIQALLIDLLMYRVSMPSQADDSFLRLGEEE